MDLKEILEEELNRDIYFSTELEKENDKRFFKNLKDKIVIKKRSHVFEDFPTMEWYDGYDFMNFMSEKWAKVYSTLGDWPYVFYFYWFDIRVWKEYFISYCEWDLNYYIIKK